MRKNYFVTGLLIISGSLYKVVAKQRSCKIVKCLIEKPAGCNYKLKLMCRYGISSVLRFCTFCIPNWMLHNRFLSSWAGRTLWLDCSWKKTQRSGLALRRTGLIPSGKRKKSLLLKRFRNIKLIRQRKLAALHQLMVCLISGVWKTTNPWMSLPISLLCHWKMHPQQRCILVQMAEKNCGTVILHIWV